VSAQSPSAELVVDGLTIRFGGLTAVEGMSFEVRTGEVLSLIGPNGAGKTTAFNAITGYIEPDGGTIAYRGHRLNGLKPSQIAARGLVRTFQKTSVFMGQSAFDNVLLGLHLASKQRPLAIILALPSVAREEKALAEEAAYSSAPSACRSAAASLPPRCLRRAPACQGWRRTRRQAEAALLDEPVPA
jgi:branched-chain amino acid transport system ATP-binding protein